MATAPTGPMGRACEYARQMVAACVAFESWTGASNATVALRSLHHGAVPKPDGVYVWTRDLWVDARPFGVVWTDPGIGYKKDYNASGMAHDSGIVLLTLEANIADDDADSPAEAKTKFLNVVDAIIDQMCALRNNPGVGPYLAFDSIEKSEGPYRVDPDAVPTLGDHQYINLSLAYGGRG